MTNITPKWVRWLLLLPASICIPAIIIFVPNLLPNIKAISTSYENFLHALSPFVSSIISILTAYVVAPSHKFRVSLAIALLWFLILLTALIIVVFKVKVDGEEQFVIDNGMATISTLIGIMVGLLVSRKAQSKRGRRTSHASHVGLQDLPEPWFWTDVDFTDQLNIEVNNNHVLFNQQLRSIAKREDNDDVLFEMLNHEHYKYTIVHLTWSSMKQDEVFPRTKLYTNWEELYSNGILIDAKLWRETSG